MWFSSILLLLCLMPGLTGQGSVILASSGSEPASGNAATGDANRRVEWIEVEGDVEIDRLEALESAEQKVREALWERFAPVWKRQAGLLVPEARVQQDLETWLERDFERLAPIEAVPVHVFSSSVGEAYRKSYRIQVAGPRAEAFRLAGESRATELSQRFRKGFFMMAVLAAFLFWGASRMDRLTRGYLTWRIRTVSLILASTGIFLLYPHV
jgi:hypothetical protein